MNRHAKHLDFPSSWGYNPISSERKRGHSMALIKCPECGREISDKAKACIHCGYPIAEIADMQEVAPLVEPTVDYKKQREIEKYNMLGDELRADKKYLAAMDCYTKSANLGSSYAQLWVGVFYDRGLGVDVNYTEAAKWYQMAAEQDNADALGNLALLYKNGCGVEQDLQKAIELNMQAIKNGNNTAIGNLGSLYHFAPAGIQSYQLARKYYEEAISLGTEQCNVYNNMGILYADGKGVPQDYFKAEQYYLKAISLGSQMAKENYRIVANNLATKYEHGDGLVQNYVKAEEYYLKAIELGNAVAKQNYGIFANNRGVAYADGKGVEQNYAKAEHYYLIAIKYGIPIASQNYEALKKRKWQYELAEKERRRAQEKAEWRERLTRTCPRCGRHSGHPISEFEKKVSIGFWGFASNKWGKSYKCDSCDYMW